MQPLPLSGSKMLSALQRKPHTQQAKHHSLFLVAPTPHPRPHPLASTTLLSVSTELPFLDISKKWNHPTCLSPSFWPQFLHQLAMRAWTSPRQILRFSFGSMPALIRSALCNFSLSMVHHPSPSPPPSTVEPSSLDSELPVPRPLVPHDSF